MCFHHTLLLYPQRLRAHSFTLHHKDEYVTWNALKCIHSAKQTTCCPFVTFLNVFETTLYSVPQHEKKQLEEEYETPDERNEEKEEGILEEHKVGEPNSPDMSCPPFR